MDQRATTGRHDGGDPPAMEGPRVVEKPRPATHADEAPATGRSSGWIAWLVFLVVVAAVSAYLWQRPQASAPVERGGRRMMQPSSIGVATVATGDMKVTLDALGSVTSLATVTVKTQVSGQLIEIDFKEGQEVKKGDPLAQIDPRPYQAALAQAQGQLSRDQALLDGAKVDLARYKGLAAQNAVPRQTLDTQTALVAQYQGAIDTDKALVEAATVNLAYCRIVAPMDGRVGLRQVDSGNYVTPGDANGIVVLTQLHPISVLFTVPEDELPAIAKRLRSGATLPVAAYDRGRTTKLADGQLETFDSQIDPTTGTIKLRASFDNGDRLLYPNQFVNVELEVDQHKGVSIVPTAAIQRGLPGTFVYVVNADGTVSVRKVELGVTDGDRVEISSGLAAGERVVVDGADKLREGAKVNVRDANGSQQPPAQAPPPADGKPQDAQQAQPANGQQGQGQAQGNGGQGQHKHQGNGKRRHASDASGTPQQ